eukprot:scaffold24654_cov101-Isochrysis_galbana.AAC.5
MAPSSQAVASQASLSARLSRGRACRIDAMPAGSRRLSRHSTASPVSSADASSGPATGCPTALRATQRASDGCRCGDDVAPDAEPPSRRCSAAPRRHICSRSAEACPGWARQAREAAVDRASRRQRLELRRSACRSSSEHPESRDAVTSEGRSSSILHGAWTRVDATRVLLFIAACALHRHGTKLAISSAPALCPPPKQPELHSTAVRGPRTDL